MCTRAAVLTALLKPNDDRHSGAASSSATFETRSSRGAGRAHLCDWRHPWRADLLVELLEGIANDPLVRPATDKVVRLLVLGDFIDRGSASRAVLEALQEASQTDKVTVLLGNHEQALIECAAG